MGKLDEYLAALFERGEVINPGVEITPEKLAEFAAQASREIDPYYSTQLKLASESFLRDVGYTTEDILRTEKIAEEKYGKTVRQLGESEAERGFAYSGARKTKEKELATDTQRQIEEGRRQAQYAGGTGAREFAQLWGSGLPEAPSITTAPTVSPGERTFQWGSGTQPFYQLSPDVYEGLIGERQWEQTAEEKRRVSELEGAWRTKQEAEEYRKLNL